MVRFVLVEVQDELDEHILGEGKGFLPSQHAEGVVTAKSAHVV